MAERKYKIEMILADNEEHPYKDEELAEEIRRVVGGDLCLELIDLKVERMKEDQKKL